MNETGLVYLLYLYILFGLLESERDVKNLINNFYFVAAAVIRPTPLTTSSSSSASLFFLKHNPFEINVES